MALTTDQAAELVSLRNALTLLRTGKLPTRVVFSGRDVSFAKVDITDLKSRVHELETLECGRRGGAIRIRL